MEGILFTKVCFNEFKSYVEIATTLKFESII